ncbi:MAG TPA: DUF4160 domain-containing protein [Chitinophagaceae bacterium]|jgi:hypothetical protein|nr:DUF4160 domain-containing protein [Chitinophagaceae bacterium]HMU58595.1 DUF4160 domain-containing protein [Chitinophagaceae bacterium]
MPTVLLLYGFRFFFYSNENNEPPHIHVRKGNGEGKIWLEPKLEFAWQTGFTKQEEATVWQLATENQDFFKQKWYEYFGK